MCAQSVWTKERLLEKKHSLIWRERREIPAEHTYTLPPVNAGEQEVNPFVGKRSVRGYNDINYTGYYVSRRVQYIRVRARTHLSYLRYRFPVEKQRRQRERRKQNLFSVSSCVLRGNMYTIKCVRLCMYTHNYSYYMHAHVHNSMHTICRERKRKSVYMAEQCCV